MINKIKNFITDNKKDILFILILVGLLLCLIIPKLLMQYKIGIGNWDTFLYLENGRRFAKMGWGDVASIAPVLPVILSKMFLIAGHPYPEAIFNIDTIFYLIGSVGLYLLFRLKFSREISLLGSVIYSTFTLLFSWVAIGGNDILGVTGTICSIYLIVIAHRYNYKFYYLALPVAAYAFLSRYTAGIMLFSIIFYWIINKISLKEFKHIIIGGILGLISISWFLYEFDKHLKTPFPFLGQFSGTVSNTVVMDSGFLPDSWYYLNHVTNYLSSNIPPVDTFNAVVNPMGNIPTLLSYIYVALMILGLALIVIKTYNKIGEYNIKSGNNMLYLTISVIIFAFIVLTLMLGLSYIITFVLILLLLSLIYFKINGEDIKNFDFELLMINLFITYFLFQSILFTKNDRYFITVLPFIAYFITYAVNELYDYIKSVKIKKMRLSTLITVILVLFLVINSISFVVNMPTENKFTKIEETCHWLKDNKIINNRTVTYSDNWPAVSWYLNIYCLRGVPNINDLNYTVDLSKQILTHSNSSYPATYYIDSNTPTKEEIAGMNIIYEKDNVAVYENKYIYDLKNKNITNETYNEYIQKDIDELNNTLRNKNA